MSLVPLFEGHIVECVRTKTTRRKISAYVFAHVGAGDATIAEFGPMLCNESQSEAVISCMSRILDEVRKSVPDARLHVEVTGEG